MVNQDAGTFSIWQANPSKNTDLVGVTSKTSATRCNNSSPPARFLPPEEQSDSYLSGGAVAGITISVMAFAASISLVAFFYLRRRKRRLRPINPLEEILGQKEVHDTSSQKQTMLFTSSGLAPERCGSVEELQSSRQELGGLDYPEVAYEIDGTEQPIQAP